MGTSQQRVLDFAAKCGLIRPRDLAEHGLLSVTLRSMVRQGLLNRVGRGLDAIPNKSRAPKIDYPPLGIVRFSGVALIEGIEERQIDAVTVRATNIARTVADCFKFRHKIGLDVALEALQEAWREKRVTMDELWHYAAGLMGCGPTWKACHERA